MIISLFVGGKDEIKTVVFCYSIVLECYSFHIYLNIKLAKFSIRILCELRVKTGSIIISVYCFFFPIFIFKTSTKSEKEIAKHK